MPRGRYRAVLLVDCTDPEDLENVKAIIKYMADKIERDTDGATIQIAGPADDIRKRDLHKLADEMFSENPRANYGKT